MRVLNYIIGIAGVYTSLWMYEVKYVWMNEADSVFAKEGFLVEFPYVETSFLGSVDVKSMIPRSHGIRMNDMKNVMCYMQYFMCYMQDIMCCVQYEKFLIQIWKVTHFPNLNLESPLTWLSIIMLLEKSCSYSFMSLACDFIYPYLVQVFNSIILGASTHQGHARVRTTLS